MSSTLRWLARSPRRASPAGGSTGDDPRRDRGVSPPGVAGRPDGAQRRGRFRMHGETIHDGDVVGLALGAANLDPAAFTDPTSCVLDRSPNPHVTFGFGRHLCVGSHVARLELTVMLEELGARVGELELDGAAELEPQRERARPGVVAREDRGSAGSRRRRVRAWSRGPKPEPRPAPPPCARRSLTRGRPRSDRRQLRVARARARKAVERRSGRRWSAPRSRPARRPPPAPRRARGRSIRSALA